MVKIMLACVAGMSTSLLVNKMQKAAADKGFEADIFAIPMTEAEDYVASNKIDVLLLGPQVRFKYEEYKEKFEPLGVKVAVIPMTDYGMMNGAKVLAMSEEMLAGE